MYLDIDRPCNDKTTTSIMKTQNGLEQLISVSARIYSGGIKSLLINQDTGVSYQDDQG